MSAPAFLSGDAVPSYLQGVELMSAGMEWHASTGDVTITLEHLADAVRASQDPHVQSPRIKLGHVSPVNGEAEDHNPFAALGDAEPCFGQFVNLRLANDGAVLLGDATNVPEWLAAIAPAAYPNRSAECVWQVDTPSLDVQTNGGRRYSCVVTAVSLLGVCAPAISDLEDLVAFTMSGPSAPTATQPTAAAASTDAAALSVSYDTIRDRFNWSWAYEREGNDFEGDTMMWWARDVRFDPNEIIADDDEGNLWSVPFTTDGEDAVTFGEPSRVRQTFVPVAAASQRVASFARPSKPAAKPSRKPAASAASDPAATARPNTEEGASMDANVREILVGQGLDPDTATEEQVSAANVFAQIAALPTSTTPPAATTEPEGEGDTAEPVAETETAPAGERVPVAASAPDPIAAAKDAAFAKLSAEVAELRAKDERTTTEAAAKRRDDAISAALSSGRITPAERDSYRKLLDIDEGEAGALLSALPPNRVPMEARAQVPDPEGSDFSADEPLPAHVSLLTPGQQDELQARRAARA